MQIRFNKSSGNVLFGTIFITGIICMYLGGYLTLVRNEHKLTNRSQTWNMAIPVAEAGVEEAMTHLQSTFPVIKAGNGWNYNAGGNLEKLRVLNTNEYFYTVIQENGGKPIITSTGYARPPVEANFISRTIEVTTTYTSYKFNGMVVRETATLGGNTITLDSFDSSTNAYSTNGVYDSRKRRDNAILATLSTNSAAIKLINADVWGKVASANSTGTNKSIVFSPNASVGDLAWHAAGKTGLQTNHYDYNVNITVESVVSPITSAIPPPAGPTNSGYAYALATGDYRFDSTLKPFQGAIHVTGNARLLVNANVDLSMLRIDPGASLEMYVAGGSADLGGNMVNINGQASNFKYFGLPGNTNISAGGGDSFTAIIYAPDAALKLNGNGGTYAFSGASLTKSVHFGGSYDFHYDESAKNETKKGYVITAWNEISNPAVAKVANR
jgi:hypothetical protein